MPVLRAMRTGRGRLPRRARDRPVGDANCAPEVTWHFGPPEASRPEAVTMLEPIWYESAVRDLEALPHWREAEQVAAADFPARD
jgi:hypothetical protein